MDLFTYYLTAVGMAIFPNDEDVEYSASGELRIGNLVIYQDFIY